MESLGSKQVALKLSTLNVIHSLISDVPHSLEEHVPDLVPRLLTLAHDSMSMVHTTVRNTHNPVNWIINHAEGAYDFIVLHWEFDQPTYTHSEFCACTN